jgi:D-glycero-alpha-D-manno-heptose-7-phosphate kinase
MIIESSAPTRVDLAGGTIDIPPLFLFHEGASTVNFAVDLMAKCRIETRDDDRIILESVDRGVRFETCLGEIGGLYNEPRLELLSKLVYFFNPETGFNMTTESEAPAGAGLAGSSTLNIACIGALNKLVGNRYPEENFIRIAANVECQVIKVPTGFQDYYSAQYGGAACIHFRPDGIEREALAVDVKTLEERIVVCYTGEPRNSGRTTGKSPNATLTATSKRSPFLKASAIRREICALRCSKTIGRESAKFCAPPIRAAKNSRRISRRRKWIR